MSSCSMGDNGETVASVRFQFGHAPSMRIITTARHFIEELAATNLGADAGSRVAMVVHELMENLAKYADGGPMCLEVELLPQPGSHCVRITATNRATPERLDKLEQILNDIASSEDPHATYLRYIHESVKRKVGSGLGLTRIRAEGDMILSHTRASNQITISAVGTFPSFEP